MVKKKSNLIFQEIIQDIKNGKYKAGDKLPSEDLFCKKYDSSRSSIREALQALSLLGLISIRPGLGTFLEKLTIDKLFNPAKIFIEPDNDFLFDLLEFRKSFEKNILEMVIDKCNQQKLNQLKQILDLTTFYFERDDEEGFNEYNLKFHEELVEITENKITKSIFNIIYPYLRYAIAKSTRIKKDKLKTIESHTEIYRCIENKDLNNGIKALTRHMDYVKKIYDNLFIRQKESL